jgi:hypothetical protein
VMAELMEEEVDEIVRPRGKHDPARVAVRDGHEVGEVMLAAAPWTARVCAALMASAGAEKDMDGVTLVASIPTFGLDTP